MRPALVLALLLVSCGLLPHGARFTAPATVQVKGSDTFCTGVLVGPRRALTAAHCLLASGGHTVSRQGGGPVARVLISVSYGDLDMVAVTLSETMPPPYAQITSRPTTGQRVRIAGYGCRPGPWGRLLEVRYLRARNRPWDSPGETEYSGEACPGDSGSGVWDLQGRLVGITWGIITKPSRGVAVVDAAESLRLLAQTLQGHGYDRGDGFHEGQDPHGAHVLTAAALPEHRIGNESAEAGE